MGILNISSMKIDGNTTSLFIFIIVLLLMRRWYKQRSQRCLPPGPWGLPFLGIIPFAGLYLHKTLQKWSHKYGNIMSFYIGPNLSISLQGYENIKEAFINHGDSFSGREFMFTVKASRGKYTGLLINQGESWQQHKRFLLQLFRELGVGQPKWEHHINEEIRFFFKEIDSHNGKSFDIHHLMNMSVANVTNKIIFGKRFDYYDEDFQKHIKMINDIMEKWALSLLFNMYPWVRHIPGDPTKYYTFMQWEHTRQFKIIQPMIDKYREENKGNPQHDVIGHYISALEQKGSTLKYSSFEMLQLRCLIDDLFFAGTETTSTTLRWAFLYMMIHPEIQEKVREEILTKIGRKRFPSLDDRDSLPYTEATLLEIQRFNTIAPLSVPHQTTSDVIFKGYHIPKGTMVYANLWALHRDPELWDNPDVFEPTRFLKDGQVIKPPYFIPFSIGKRICAGEMLAKSEMFLYFTAMIQNYRLTLPKHSQTPSLDGRLGVTLYPEPYQLIAEKIV